MRQILRNNGLSLVMMSVFILCLLGQTLAGYYVYNAEQHAHQQAALPYMAYLTSGHLWASIFENWESEFVQMTAYVLCTVFLWQRGSAESKDPEGHEEVDEDPLQHRHDPQAPGPVRRGGLLLTLYAHSFSTALLLLFFFSLLGHVYSGASHYNATQLLHGQEPVSVLQYVVSAQFWFESLQNWQSEFLAVVALVVLSIWLRERGSPESKPVHWAHTRTGR
ncbi:MAG: DUF6766 family protein [Candidatus Tectimicrobiota bacterium]